MVYSTLCPMSRQDRHYWCALVGRTISCGGQSDRWAEGLERQTHRWERVLHGEQRMELSFIRRRKCPLQPAVHSAAFSTSRLLMQAKIQVARSVLGLLRVLSSKAQASISALHWCMVNAADELAAHMQHSARDSDAPKVNDTCKLVRDLATTVMPAAVAYYPAVGGRRGRE